MRRGNPADHEPSFRFDFHPSRGGGYIEMWPDGEVNIYDNVARLQDSYFVQASQVDQLRKDISGARLGAWHHFTREMLMDDYKFQKAGGRYLNPLPPVRRAQLALRKALMSRHSRRRNCGTRRNSPISKSAARSMKSVLRKHGYRCNPAYNRDGSTITVTTSMDTIYVSVITAYGESYEYEAPKSPARLRALNAASSHKAVQKALGSYATLRSINPRRKGRKVRGRRSAVRRKSRRAPKRRASKARRGRGRSKARRSSKRVSRAKVYRGKNGWIRKGRRWMKARR
jgi:hypothetical protein